MMFQDSPEIRFLHKRISLVLQGIQVGQGVIAVLDHNFQIRDTSAPMLEVIPK